MNTLNMALSLVLSPFTSQPTPIKPSKTIKKKINKKKPSQVKRVHTIIVPSQSPSPPTQEKNDTIILPTPTPPPPSPTPIEEPIIDDKETQEELETILKLKDKARNDDHLISQLTVSCRLSLEESDYFKKQFELVKKQLEESNRKLSKQIKKTEKLKKKTKSLDQQLYYYKREEERKKWSNTEKIVIESIDADIVDYCKNTNNPDEAFHLVKEHYKKHGDIESFVAPKEFFKV
jgi:hypothetical protein